MVPKDLNDKDDSLLYYIDLLKSGDKQIIDTIYGVRKLHEDRLLIGNSILSFDDEFISVNTEKYPRTKGLIELLFKKNPDESLVNQEDLDNYRQILKSTYAHRKFYQINRPIRDLSSEKYKKIIMKIITPRKKAKNDLHSGGKLISKYMIADRRGSSIKRKMDYVYWDDPNELVNRLRLLMASQAAGNLSHNNEIVSIVEELREAGIIH